jgi:hypothetical protein
MSWLITGSQKIDPDAAVYLSRVEDADGQALEAGVRTAVDQFVLGCKADGIWDAIKASCIMAGARTLAGALVPLKGTAPTNVNFNFVSGDYNRKTGLKGDGSTKYLDSNRNNDDDPQDNQHLSCFITTYPAGFNSALMGSGVFSDSGNSYLLRGAYIGVKSQTGGSVAITGPNSDPVGLFGVSRNNNSNFSYRLIGVNNLASFASVTPRFNGNTLVFARGTTVSLDQPTNARLAFYSIGESLDLALLDARVTTLINNINDALTWGWAMTITIADTTHTLRLNAACTFVVDWGDGTRDTLTSTTGWTYTKTYAAPGTYRLRFSIQSGTFYPYYNNVTADVAELRTLEGTGPEAWSFGSLSGAFYGASGLTAVSEGMNTAGLIDFFRAWHECSSLTSFPPLDVSSGTNFQAAWRQCSSLTSFPLLDVSSGTNFSFAWLGCTSLASFPPLDVSSGTNFTSAWWQCTSLTSFPPLDVSSGTNFQAAWYECSSLTSFPPLDVSSGTNFQSAWSQCSSLTSFPLLDVSSGTNFQSAWSQCSSLTSFPLLDVSSGINFTYAWLGCTSLASFPANFFDVTGTLNSTAFADAFLNCALTAASIENILTSLVTNGQSNITLGLTGGTNAGAATWTPAAVAAYDTLTDDRGWTISRNA